MAVETASVVVGAGAPVRLSAAADTDGSTPGHSVLFTPPQTIYIGPAGVTAATGWATTPGQEYALDLGPGDALFAITASGNVTVPVLRTGV